jgi:hypothetical protein
MTPEQPVRLSAEQHAEKIRNILIDCQEGRLDEAVALIMTQIREAVEEAEADRDRWADSACRLEKALEKVKVEAYEEGRQAAFLDAAKILEACIDGPDLYDENRRGTPHSFARGMAARIRARATRSAKQLFGNSESLGSSDKSSEGEIQ